MLEKLLILDSERLSYRTLDVEEIGSVYQTIMGFRVEVSRGNAIALKGKRKKGGVPAAPVINLDDLLGIAAKDRAKWLKEHADTELTGEALELASVEPLSHTWQSPNEPAGSCSYENGPGGGSGSTP